MSLNKCERCSDHRRSDFRHFGVQAPLCYYLCSRCYRDAITDTRVRMSVLEESSVYAAYLAELAGTDDKESHRRHSELAHTAAIRLHQALRLWQATWG